MPPVTETTSNAAEFTVSEISFALKRSVEDQFGFVRVRGEISGYRGPHSSGHAYFALKDEGARIEAVVWRGVFGKLRFKPEEGMEVIATGKLTTYPNSSKYQIVIDALEPAGAGALMALLEERKRKLATEGLFEASRKQLLPYLPRVVGVVTSPTGAVIRDILHRLADRFPVHVLVWPVKVQGDSCGPEVAAGIAGFNALPEGGKIPRPDVIIVARGGGSLEDLWGFNDEVVVRAAAASEIPLVSAVGHETDWTLIDLAADVRAPTPTGAAEMVVPVRRELLDRVDDLGRRLNGASLRAIDLRRTRLVAASRALPRASDILALPRQRFDSAANALPKALSANTTLHARRYERIAARLTPQNLLRTQAQLAERLDGLTARAGRAVSDLIARRRARLDQVTSVFDAVNHMATLRRGYALVRDEAGKPLFRAEGLTRGTAIEIEFADGRVNAAVGDDAPPRSAAPEAKPRRAKPKTAAPDDQGDLF